ncbi:MAG: protein-L-isoaspartate(D-aspartate) O-methyltransferase [Alphaproteobacteria bacterium]
MADSAERDFEVMREAMIDVIVEHARRAGPEIGREKIGTRVLQAMGRLPRHEFVPLEIRPFAYLDQPLPIGCGKTISQPFIVALMTDLLEVGEGDTVLEIGTGFGYQAAVLSALAGKVYTVELIEELAEEAAKRFARLGITNIESRVGDGARGWAEAGPFERILVTAAPDLIPPALFGQLKPGGRMVVPAGIAEDQRLMLVTKDANGRLESEQLLSVRFSALESEDEYE